MMHIVPEIFRCFPEIIAAQSTREGGVSPMPLGLNLSNHVGDDPANVAENRKRFYAEIGVPADAQFVYQNQIHSGNVNVVQGGEGVVPNSDALVTSEQNTFLVVSIADCTPILLYDPVAKIVAAVHAGWRGTEQLVTVNAVRAMAALGARPERIYAFIGASASGEHYEVGAEVATLFEKNHYTELPNGKCLLDIKKANRDQLLIAGLPLGQIEINPRCTITDDALHSYRRDGKRSGRMFAVIGKKEF
ncbi:MAG TPA: peptidoglycan editing factor PgeF [Candidatus Kapabacteria bacterium]|nr:peptidoglycan editing factor PgeF [Candidatus Kapabacteria bacterium]